ncbi:hypothetical protein Tco_0780521 [Tanacetum coccineum]
MCCQPLPPSAKLMIMALEEYGYQSRRGIRVPKKLRSSYSGDVILKKSFELMIDDDDDDDGDDDNPFGVLFCRIVRILIFDL